MAAELIDVEKKREITPVDQVIAKVKALINSGILKPGDRLPAERKMAADFGFGRTHIREALHKLEFYGIIKTLPQSGSIINGLDINTLDGLISDILNLQDHDFFSLVEMRFMMEINSVRLCAERWVQDDMEAMEKAHSNYVKFIESPARVGYDFAFHRAIAEGTQNQVLKAMLLVVNPDIMAVYEKERICETNTTAGDEHQQILAAIKDRDPDLAASLMVQHLQAVLSFAKERIKQ